jgi:hypothetical protein
MMIPITRFIMLITRTFTTGMPHVRQVAIKLALITLARQVKMRIGRIFFFKERRNKVACGLRISWKYLIKSCTYCWIRKDKI